MQRSALCRSRRELSNAHFLAKFCFDTSENEPSKVCPIERCSSPVGTQLACTRARGPPNRTGGFSTAGESLARLRARFQERAFGACIVPKCFAAKPLIEDGYVFEVCAEIGRISANFCHNLANISANLATSRYDFANSGKISASFDKKLRFES